MGKNINTFQKKVLKILSGKMDDFYLAGGTALALYYFQHRESADLDFFTRSFSKKRIREIVSLLSDELEAKMELIAQESRKDRVKTAVYSAPISKNLSLKIDFVEDYVELIKELNSVNGIKVLSLEDIYIRKVYTVSGTFQEEDSIGRKVMMGGRQTAKDFYDLYCLSSIFMRLSDFLSKYCNPVLREGVIRWFRTYSRMDIKTGLLELKLKKGIDYKDMERHFKKEIDRVLDREAGM